MKKPHNTIVILTFPFIDNESFIECLKRKGKSYEYIPYPTNFVDEITEHYCKYFMNLFNQNKFDFIIAPCTEVMIRRLEKESIYYVIIDPSIKLKYHYIGYMYDKYRNTYEYIFDRIVGDNLQSIIDFCKNTDNERKFQVNWRERSYNYLNTNIISNIDTIIQIWNKFIIQRACSIHDRVMFNNILKEDIFHLRLYNYIRVLGKHFNQIYKNSIKGFSGDRNYIYKSESLVKPIYLFNKSVVLPPEWVQCGFLKRRTDKKEYPIYKFGLGDMIVYCEVRDDEVKDFYYCKFTKKFPAEKQADVFTSIPDDEDILRHYNVMI